ncbi:MAG TPA: hypothetical protein PKI93_01715 [Alphaproteobacteria bacterium]|nr:hypothetical protein [Alphaproteobacteria bacterium]HNS44833.1 hypothetical protein [Alphaproteobacteria bacterium]
MNDITKDFESMGAQMAAGPASYGHPQADIIRKECESLLSKTSEGTRLLGYKNDNNIRIDIIAGKKVDWKASHADNTAYIFCPANTKAVDLEEMALGYAIAIREMEHKDLGIRHPDPVAHPAEENQLILLDYFLDMNMEMCKIVSEFEKSDKETKFLDLVKKLGQDDFYREYVSGKSKQELKETLNKTLTNIA